MTPRRGAGKRSDADQPPVDLRAVCYTRKRGVSDVSDDRGAGKRISLLQDWKGKSGWMYQPWCGPLKITVRSGVGEGKKKFESRGESAGRWGFEERKF